MPEGGTAEVEIALVNPGSLESDETVMLTLTAEGVSVSTGTLVLSMTASSATLTIDAAGVAAGTAGSVTATGVVLSGGSVVENKSVVPATLAVTVVREREFVLRFETLSGEALSSVEVVAGTTTEVAVALTNVEALEPGEAVSVSVTLTAVVQQLTLTAATPRITLSIRAAVDAVAGGTLEATGVVLLNGAMVAHTRVRPATLEVEILPRRFALRFETPEGTVLERAQVVAGSTTEVAVVLTDIEALEPDEAISVTLTTETVSVVPPAVTLTTVASRAVLTIGAAVNAMSGTLMAEADIGGVTYIVVQPATLSVEVVPRRFALRFETPEGTVLERAQVVAGSTTEVAVALTDAEALEPGETVSVTLTVEGVGVSTDTVVLSMTASSAMLTINAAVNAMSGTLMAEADTAGVMNIVVQPATLTVSVVREFVLRFETLSGEALSSVEVVAGATTEVAVALTNVEALEPGEAVSVSVTLTAIVQQLTLTAATPRITLSIRAAVDAVAGGTLEATGVVLLNGAMVAHTRVRPATLAVEILPRRFGLRFETPEGTVLERAQVVAGSTTEVAVALTDAEALEPGETVSVTLTVEGVGVSTDTVVLSMTASSAMLTINAAVNAMSGTLMAEADTAGVMNIVVQPATLTVSVVREFVLRFETLSGEALSSVEVVSGATTEVAVALTNVEALEPGEAVSVSVTLTAVVQQLTLSEATPRITLSIRAAVDAVAGGTLEATGVVLLNGAMVAHTRVRPATLAVEILPRRFGLRFETPEGTVLERAQVVAGSTTEVMVVLENADLLEPDEAISVTLTTVTVSVVPPVVTLTAAASSAVLTIGAAVNVTSGTLTAEADVAGVAYIVVQPATLSVEVLPRRFALRFETPEGTVLETVQVVAGSTTEVAVALTNAEALEPDETVSVTLTTEGVDVSTDAAVLSVTASSAMLTIGAAVTAMSGTLTAKADTAGVMNAVVEPATLSVEVLPEPVELQLAFASPALTVAADARRTAQLRLVGDVPAGAEVTVELSATNTAIARVMQESVVFTAQTQSRDVRILGVAEGMTTVTAIADTSGLPEGSTVAPAELAVTVVPAVAEPVMLQLAFGPMSLEVEAGSTATAVLSLPGVPEGIEVAVPLSAADEATASVMPSTVTFTADTTSPIVTATVTVTGVAAGSATVTAAVSADALAASGLPDDSTVASAELVVTVVPVPEPPEPVELQLAFAPTALEVTAGATATAVLSLPDVPADAAVTVSLSAADAATASVMPSTVTFTADTPSPVMTATVTVSGVAAGMTTVTAVADVSGLPDDSTVAPAELSVTVVPVPAPVELVLAFDPSTLTVTVAPAGSEETAMLSLPDVPNGATVTVTLNASSEAAQVTPESVVFTAATTSRDVTVLGLTEGSVTVTAAVSADALAGSGLPPGSTVALAELSVTVAPPSPVHLQLAFDPMSLEVAVDARATAVLSLLGVPGIAQVLVELGVSDADEVTARLVSPGLVVFDAMTTSQEVTVEGVAEGRITLTASRRASNLPAGSTVMPAELVVTVVPAPVHLQLAFEPPALEVATGATATATLRLPDVPAGAAVTVELSVTDATTAQVVTSQSVVFSAETQSHDVTILGVAAGSATLTVVATDISDLPADSTVASAELAVTTVVPAPVHLVLAFDPPALTVAVGSERTAILSLSDVPTGAVVTVALSTAATATAQVVPESVVFDSETPSRDVMVLGVVEGSATLTAVVDADALAESGLPAGSTVVSTELAVTVVMPDPDPVMLQLAFDPTSLTVAAGATATAVLRLSAVPEGVEVPVDLSVPDATTARVLQQSVIFTADAPSRDVTVLGEVAGSVTVTAVADDSGLPPGSTVAPAELAVTVVLPTVELQLAFAPMSLEVAVGTTATAVLSLPGVPVGAEVTVAVLTEDSVTAQVLTELEVVFDAATPSRDVTVEGVTVGNATLTAELASFDGLSTVSTVLPADLAVTVVPASVHLQLAFAPMSLEVTAGSTETAVLSLLDVPAGATVTVTLSASGEAAQVMPESVTFSATTTSRDVTVLGVTVGNATLTAELASFDGLSTVSTVLPADLAVTVVPAPVHLQLAFAPMSLTVTAGATATVVLRLLGDVPAGAEVSVLLREANSAVASVFGGRRLSGGRLFNLVEVSGWSREVGVSGVAEGSATLTAVEDVSSGLPDGSTVAPAELVVTVVPAPVRLQLMFDPPTLTVTAGSSETAVLSLSGVPEGATVTVELSATSTATAQVTPESVAFTAATTSRDVTVLGEAAGSATVMAAVDENALADFGLPAGSTVAPADLAVEVLSRRFSLRFETPEGTVLAMAQVVAGSTVEVAVALTDDSAALEPGETVSVALTAEGVDVSTDAAVLSVTAPRTTLTIDAAGVAVGVTGSVTATGVVLSGGSAAENTSVDPATLTVPVVRELVLRFETLSDEPEVLSSVEVVAGATTKVAVVLTNIEVLEPGEAVSVSVMLTAIVQQLTLTEATPRTTLNIRVAADAAPEGTVEATGVVLLNGAMVAHTRVRMATLAIKVLPRRFGLRFETLEGTVLETARVVAGGTTEVVVALTNAEALEPDEAVSVALTAEGVDVSTDTVVLSMNASREVLTIDAAVNAMSGTLMAEADIGGVTYIAVEPATLSVEVLPRRFALRFETPEGAVLETAQVVAGSTTEVMVALTDAEALEPGETISVTLTAEGVDVSTDTVVLSVAAPWEILTIGVAVNAMSGTLTAAADTAGVMNAVVQPATLSVEVLPRRFSLRFETPEGTVLEMAQVVAGSTTGVMVALTDAEALEPGETVSVTLTAATLSVVPPVVTLTGTAPRAALRIGASVNAMSGTLTAADTAGVMNAVVQPATLSVEVLPRRFALRFETLSGEVLSSVDVVAGATTEVAVALTDVEALEPDETVSVTLTAEGVDVSTDTVVLSMTASSAVLTIDAAVTATSGTVTADADTAGVMNMVVEPATLPVEILPRRFALRFETLEGTVLETAQVVAGSTTEVMVALENADLLEPDEAVSVTLTTATLSVVPPVVTLTETTPRAALRIGAAVNAMSGTLTAAADTAGVMNMVVEPATLPVEILPAPVVLQLAFDRLALEVVAGATATSTLSLPGVPAGAEVTVELSAADAATARLVTEPELRFTAQTPSRDVTVEGVVAGNTTVTVVATDISDLPPNSTVASAELAVTVVAAPVHLQLAFDRTSLTVAVDARATAVLSLLGDVPEDAEVRAVLLNERIVNMTPGVVVFDAVTTSRDVAALGVSAGNTIVRAFMSRDDFAASGLPDGSTVAPADLAVTVVPAPVRLQLAFAPPDLTVTADSEETAMLSLPDVPAGATVTVTLSAASTAIAQVTPESVTFTATTTSRDVTVLGVAAGSVTVTADEDDISDLPPNSTVVPAELLVTVVAAPVHLQLAFDRTSLTVAAGSEETVVLSLLSVPAGATVTVTLSSADTATALVMPSTVTFTADTPSRNVTVTGEAAGSVTLTAVEDDISDLPEASTVAPAELAVTVEPAPVVPLPVELQLAFAPTALEVEAGATATAVLSLLGELSAGATVTVTLSVAGDAAQLVTPESVVLDADTPSNRVTVMGVVAGSATLTASADISGAPAGSTVASADLAVTVMPAPVRLQLAFAPLALEVEAGAEATVELSFVEELPAGATVTVTLSSADTATALVMPSTVTFTADTTSRDVTVLGVAAGNTTVTAVMDRDDFAGSGLPPDSTVAPAELLVTVVPAPVHLQLAFEPPTLEVVAGATATATLQLLGDVLAGATVTVALGSADTATALVMPSTVTFTAGTQSSVVTVEGVAEGSVAVTAVADDSGLPAGSIVASAELAVTVVPAPEPPEPVELQLAFAPTALEVEAGATATAVLSLPGVPAGVEVAVSLSAASTAIAQVTPESVTFTATTTSRDVTVLGVAAGSVTLTADEDDISDLPPNSTVASAELAVTVVPAPVVPLPVELQLAFAPTALEVEAGATATAVLSLPGVPAGVEVAVSLSAASTATAQVRPQSVTFTATTQSRTVTVTGVAAGDTMVTAVEDVSSGLPAGSTVASAELTVTVVAVPEPPEPVELQLAFAPTALEVEAGATATAVLSLPGVPAGVEVAVSLSAASTAIAQVTPESVTFTATTQSHTVTVTGEAAGSVAVTAVADDSGLPAGSTVASAELAVTVVPAPEPPEPVELQLAFAPTALDVEAGATATAVLSLPDVPAGVEVAVSLSVASTATAEVTPQSVTFTATTQSRTVTVLGVAAGSATVTAVEDVSSGLPAGSIVASTELAVTVVAVPEPPELVELQLAFAPTALEVEAGATATAVLSLLGVPADAAVTVTLSVASTATAEVTPQSVTFTATTQSRTVTVTGVAAGDTMVTAVEDVSSGLPAGSTVASAELTVTVVAVPEPPEPVELQLAFAPTALEVEAGATATAVLSLLGVPADAAVTVTLSAASTATAEVTPQSVTFTATTQSHTVTVTGEAAGSVAVTAVADDSGLPAGSTVASAELAVTVVPAPEPPEPVELQLAFAPTALEVEAGATATAVLSLPGVPADAVVTVTLSAASTATAEVTPQSVTFTAQTQSTDVTVLGEAAGSVAVTAVADDSGLPAGSTVASAELAVTVVPAPEPPEPVELQLAFAPTALEVEAGATATAVLSLPGVPAGVEVAVSLSAASTAIAQVTPESVTFTATTTSRDVTVLGVAAGSVTLTADEDDISDLPPNSTVASAELAVTVVPAPVVPLPVELQLAFAPTALTVTAGAAATVTLRLADVPAGATVTVMLSSADTATALVMPSTLTFTATTQSRTVTVTGVAAGSATVTASVGRDALADSLPPNSSVASAELAVTVVPAPVVPLPVALQLAFAPTALEVTAGATTTAVLSLSGVPTGAEVTVTLSAAGDAAQLVTPESVVLDADTPSNRVTVMGVVAGSATVTAVADRDALVDSLPSGSTVASAELTVTVVPAPVVPLPVELQLAFAPTALEVEAGATATAVLSLLGVPADAAVTVTLSTASTATAEVTPQSVTFTATTQSRTVTVTGVAAGSVTVMAVEDVSSGLPAGSSVASADLAVTVVPLPVELQLAFAPTALEVTAGATATAVLSLSGDVPEGATVTVELSAASTATAQVRPEEVTFGAMSPSYVVTITGIAEGNVTVTATADTADLPPGSSVASTRLQVTVVRETPGLQLRVRVLLEGPLQ